MVMRWPVKWVIRNARSANGTPHAIEAWPSKTTLSNARFPVGIPQDLAAGRARR
jgi:hypothetical protein